MNFINYNQAPVKKIAISNGLKVESFITSEDSNLDKDTVDSFGEEWSKFNAFTQDEINIAGDQYFDIVSDDMINAGSMVLDIGCGSGRWSRYLAPRVKFIEAIDPSNAVITALNSNQDIDNIRFTKADIENIPFAKNSFDFIISLGVLHHIPNTQLALNRAIQFLKPGGCILLYLYYALDNRGWLYRLLFKLSSIFRKGISKMPGKLKRIICDFIAIMVYMPFILIAHIVLFLFPTKNYHNRIPLSFYHNQSFRIIRNDALDRFGTPLEHRFKKQEIVEMMSKAGLENLVFSKEAPFWHVTGKKRNNG